MHYQMLVRCNASNTNNFVRMAEMTPATLESHFPAEVAPLRAAQRSQQREVASSHDKLDQQWLNDRIRAEVLLDERIELMPSPSFRQPDAANKILGPMPRASSHSQSAPNVSRKAPAGTPAYLVPLYSLPLLTHAQEQHLFRKMNYLKYLAAELRQAIDLEDPQPELLDEIESLLSRSLRVRNRIVRCNLRLVVSIAKTVVDRANPLEELISDGNLPLIRAVEIFDFERGTRFSTYATWAIRNSLYRATPRNRRHQHRFVTGTQPLFAAVSDQRFSVRAEEGYRQTLRNMIEQMLLELDQRDQAIVISRFGLNNEGRTRTLREIAEKLSISTERVRQLLARSLKRMRESADCEPEELHA
jgi:RNA polymerase sigma factor (sigma-70 family)